MERKWALATGITLWAMAITAGIGYGCAFQEIDGNQFNFRNLADNTLLYAVMLTAFVMVLVLDILSCYLFCNLFGSWKNKLAPKVAQSRFIYSLFWGYAIYQLLPMPNSDTISVAEHLANFQYYWSVGLLVFAIHLFILGYAFWQTQGTPKWISVSIWIGALCYLGTNGLNLGWEQYATYKASVESITSLPMAFGELGFATWLLIKFRKKNSLLNQQTLSNPA